MACDAGTDVDCDPRELVADHLAFARVHARPDLEPQPADRLDGCLRAANSAGRPVERREEPVAGGVQLAAPESLELAANGGVMCFEELAPAPVAEFGRALGRTVDVREEHGCQHAVRLIGLPPPGQELADLLEDLVAAIPGPRNVDVARELDVAGSGDV